jgi:iron complex transport system permease protein
MLLIVSVVLTVLLMLVGIATGAAQLTVGDVAGILFARLTGSDPTQMGYTLSASEIVWSIRLPRVLAAVLCGCALAVSGAIFQSVLLSPLADAYTMGSSSGAAFGAVLGLYLNMLFDLRVSTTAFAFLMAAASLAVVLCASRGAAGRHQLIMAGVIVGSIMSAGISFLKVLAGDMIGSVSIFLIGSLSSIGMKQLSVLAAVTLTGCGIALVGAYRLNIMTLGDSEARQLGINTSLMRMLYCGTAAALTAACVAVCGTIGFIGLIVPHVVRTLVGSDNRRVLPLCMTGGALLLLLADTVSRVLLPRELPVGVMTTLLGGPFFMWLFIRQRRKEEM